MHTPKLDERDSELRACQAHEDNLSDRKKALSPHLCTYLPPSLHVRLRGEGTGVRVSVHRQIRVIAPEGLRLGRGPLQGHVVTCVWKKSLLLIGLYLLKLKVFVRVHP